MDHSSVLGELHATDPTLLSTDRLCTAQASPFPALAYSRDHGTGQHWDISATARGLC